ncbi:MAG: cytidine deaminase [Coriobacteriia bacterium]|nr:cytidine deaminase [Actinomycetota bacterium]MDZ4167703.1 cytidine deaminase [Coriobacteriia bacterium]
MPRHITEADLALLAFAREVRSRSYSPYSGFRVGAAVFAGGEIFQGVNVENAAYGSCICAERSAALAAVTAGHTDFDAVAVVGDSEAPTVPCGACRQFLAEFNPSMRVIMGGRTDAVDVRRLDELLPDAFVRGYLDQDDGNDDA